MRSLPRFACFGVVAWVLAPVGASATTTSCNIPQPCAVFANNSGIALQGESAGGDGVLGEASSGTIYGAGIEGESLKQTGADAAGTFGLTLLSNGVAPNYGVVAYGSLYGVYGQAGNTGLSKTGPGFGVFGQDNAGSSSGDYNVGVTGLSANNVGVLAEGNGAPTQSAYGSGSPIGLYAVAKKNGSGNSTAIVAESDEVGEVVTNTGNLTTLQVDSASDFLYAFRRYMPPGLGSPPEDVVAFSVDDDGNAFVGGNLQVSGTTTNVHGGPYLQTTGASGRTVTAYSEHTTTPEMEDFGEAQLVNGRAFVPIDAALADVTDLRRGYHVFVTPEGDSNALYVVKSAAGFLVREQRGGRSNMAFDYRIVAKPREERGERLASVTGIAPRVESVAGVGGARTQRIPLPLSPEERLKRKIGEKAYSEIVAALSKRFASLPSR